MSHERKTRPVILVHGIGNHHSGWTDSLKNLLPLWAELNEFTYEGELEAAAFGRLGKLLQRPLWSDMAALGAGIAWGTAAGTFVRWMGPKIQALLGDYSVDIPAYFVSQSVFEASRNKLIELLKQTPGALVVAHSLGSVLAYEVIQHLEQEGSVPLEDVELVTVGSPLGRRLIHWLLRKRTPIRSLTLPWLNMHGWRDWVCGPPGVNSMKTPQPSQNKLIRSGHSIEEYLKALPWQQYQP